MEIQYFVCVCFLQPMICLKHTLVPYQVQNVLHTTCRTNLNWFEFKKLSLSHLRVTFCKTSPSDHLKVNKLNKPAPNRTAPAISPLVCQYVSASKRAEKTREDQGEETCHSTRNFSPSRAAFLLLSTIYTPGTG